MRSTGSVKTPIVHRPTKADAIGETLHTNFADENFLASSCGFLNGYLDERLMAGSNVLRHKLPPVTLRRSASEPGKRDPEFRILSEMKAFEGVLGVKGARLVGKMRENLSREKVDVAFAAGDMKALRAAVRSAQFGSRLEKDPQVRHVAAVIAKYDKCLIEFRDGLAERDMIRVQLAMHHLEQLAEQGLGARVMENSFVVNARAALDKWAPYRPYLHKLAKMRLAGPRPLAQYWLVLVEGTLLSPELEASATADLARFGQAGVEALEEALAVPEVRFHYDVPWPKKNHLPQYVRGRITKLEIDVSACNLHFARERDAEGWPQADAPTSIVVSGPSLVLTAIERLADLPGGEPLCGLQRATPDTPEQRGQRAAAHRKRLAAALSILPEEEYVAALDSPGASMSGGGSIRSNLKAKRSNLKALVPSRGPWYAPNCYEPFGKTI